MKDFITSLLEFSKLEKQKKKREVDMVQLIENIKVDLHNLIERNKASVVYKGEALKIMAFEPSLIKLFQNLIINGIKYTEHGTKSIIVINSEVQADSYKFSVSDNGIGISEKHFDKIFEVFQRLHSREEYSGTGIGLSYCKKVVELHDGQIWLESGEGKGSTFYFTISK